MFTYLRYFIFLAWNWNPRLAAFILKHELKGEKKYKHLASGINDLSASLSEEQRKTASIYQPVNFFAAEWLFERVDSRFLKTKFLDAGCGKGRAMMLAAHYGFKQIEGFDLSSEMVLHALETARLIHERFSDAEVIVSCDDAREFEIADDTGVVFLFNPFNEDITTAFVEKLVESLKREPRPCLVLYANAVHKKVFTDSGFTERESMQKLTYVQATILQYVP